MKYISLLPQRPGVPTPRVADFPCPHGSSPLRRVCVQGLLSFASAISIRCKDLKSGLLGVDVPSTTPHPTLLSSLRQAGDDGLPWSMEYKRSFRQQWLHFRQRPTLTILCSLGLTVAHIDAHTGAHTMSKCTSYQPRQRFSSSFTSLKSQSILNRGPRDSAVTLPRMVSLMVLLDLMVYPGVRLCLKGSFPEPRRPGVRLCVPSMPPRGSRCVLV